MKPFHKKILVGIVFIGLIILARALGVGRYLSLENLRLYHYEISGLIAAHYLASVAVYIASYIVVTALSIPGATVMTLAGGFFFGMIGAVYVNIGATAGATAAFLAARYVLGGGIQQRYGEKLSDFNREIEAHGSNYLLTLRFIPLFPFFLINLFAGLTAVKLRTFVWTTAVGIIPGSLAFIYAGTRLGEVRTASDIFSWKLLSAFLALGAIALLPVIVSAFKKK